MRGSSDWVNALEKAIKNIDLNESKASNYSDLNVSKNILAYRMGDVFIWNENTLSLFCINVKKAAEDSVTNYYQELFWNNSPSFEVQKISLSPTESQLVLYGTEGAQILSIPATKGTHGMFKDGADSVSCRCLSVDEQYFVMSGKKILCCKWHPGFSSPNILVILTSDNFFRFYRADSPHEPFQTIDLNIPLVSSKNVLGESFISFDFSNERLVSNQSEQPDLYWNAYVLIGNGQVCSCALSYDVKNSFKHVLRGPLNMYPPAEDNYGCDACSILYIDSNPPAIVIATSEGKLHHCILLDSDDAEDEETLKEQSLFVYETVQLELSLKTAPLDNSLGNIGDDIDPFSCSLQLYRDPVMKQRYHCCHLSGLHTVNISWLCKLEEYFEGNGIKLDALEGEGQCIVEHLLCTKPLSSSSITPIIGFAQIADVCLGSKAVCLTDDLQINIFPLLQSYKSMKNSLGFENPSELKPLKTRNDVTNKIENILHKKTMNPIIKGAQSSSSQDRFKLLCRATQVFREEYIQKYEQVQVELERNVFRLKKMKSRQGDEAKQLHDDFDNIRDKQRNLSAKFELVTKNHEKLNERLKGVGLKIEASIPMLSEAEERMKKTLNDLQLSANNYDKSIKQMSRKSDHYHKEKAKSNYSTKSDVGTLTEEKANSIRTLLKKEGEEIAALKNDMKAILKTFEI